MKFLIVLFLISFLIIPAFAETNSQTLSTEKGTLDIKLTYDKIVPGDQTRLLIDFINPQTQNTQQHVDYTLSISKDGKFIFGPIPLTHTSEGVVEGLKVEFPEEGVYSVEFGIEGILFQPIPLEKVSFDIIVGNAEPTTIPTPTDKKGGGCLIATAAFDSELSPQVQQLRELRDDKILNTESGRAFMTTFNQFYYSFSPTIADYEREQPIFKEMVKLTLTPMLTSLSLLNHVNIDSEQEILGYGISLILLNIGMYVGIPIFGIINLYRFKKSKN